MQKHLSTIKSFIIVLALTVGVSYIFAWTGPTATPPNINAPAPINVSDSAQRKDGGLTLGGAGWSFVDFCKIHMDGLTVVKDVCLSTTLSGNTVIQSGWYGYCKSGETDGYSLATSGVKTPAIWSTTNPSPTTGYCSCQSGYTIIKVASLYTGTTTGYTGVFTCMKD